MKNVKKKTDKKKSKLVKVKVTTKEGKPISKEIFDKNGNLLNFEKINKKLSRKAKSQNNFEINNPDILNIEKENKSHIKQLSEKEENNIIDNVPKEEKKLDIKENIKSDDEKNKKIEKNNNIIINETEDIKETNKKDSNEEYDDEIIYNITDLMNSENSDKKNINENKEIIIDTINDNDINEINESTNNKLQYSPEIIEDEPIYYENPQTKSSEINTINIIDNNQTPYKNERLDTIPEISSEKEEKDENKVNKNQSTVSEQSKLKKYSLDKKEKDNSFSSKIKKKSSKKIKLRKTLTKKNFEIEDKTSKDSSISFGDNKDIDNIQQVKVGRTAPKKLFKTMKTMGTSIHKQIGKVRPALRRQQSFSYLNRLNLFKNMQGVISIQPKVRKFYKLVDQKSGKTIRYSEELLKRQKSHMKFILDSKRKEMKKLFKKWKNLTFLNKKKEGSSIIKKRLPFGIGDDRENLLINTSIEEKDFDKILDSMKSDNKSNKSNAYKTAKTVKFKLFEKNPFEIDLEKKIGLHRRFLSFNSSGSLSSKKLNNSELNGFIKRVNTRISGNKILKKSTKKINAYKNLYNFFNNYINYIVPELILNLNYYNIIPSFIDSTRNYINRITFNKILISSNEKYKKLFKLLNEKQKKTNNINERENFKDIQNIAAELIQKKWNEYKNKKLKNKRIIYLMKIIYNKNKNYVKKKLFIKKWQFRIKKLLEYDEISKNKIKNLAIRLRLNIFIDKFMYFIENLQNKKIISTFILSLKHTYCKKIFYMLKAKYILYRTIMSFSDYQSVYLLHRKFNEWDKKCKIMIRTERSLIKMKKTFKNYGKKVLLLALKIIRFKIHLITFALNKKKNKCKSK